MRLLNALVPRYFESTLNRQHARRIANNDGNDGGVIFNPTLTNPVRPGLGRLTLSLRKKAVAQRCTSDGTLSF